MLKVKEITAYKIETLVDVSMPEIFGLYFLSCTRDEYKIKILRYIAENWVARWERNGEVMIVNREDCATTFMRMEITDNGRAIFCSLAHSENLIYDEHIPVDELVDWLNIDVEED